MPPEESPAPDASQPATDSPSQTVEMPAEAVPETLSVPTEGAPTPETAQIPPNEPLPPEPPSSAASLPTGILHNARELLVNARIAIQDRKRKKRDKIMLLLATKNHITNDEVEKLLHVSDATATRYLSALEKENKIKQVGKTGARVAYSKI